MAHLAGRLGKDDVARHRRVLNLLGLPTSYAPDRWEMLHSAMAVDKKARGSVLRFIVLQGIGNPVALDGPETALLEAAYEAISE